MRILTLIIFLVLLALITFGLQNLIFCVDKPNDDVTYDRLGKQLFEQSNKNAKKMLTP